MGIKDYFLTTITPKTWTKSSDGKGGYTTTWANGSAFLGRVRTLSANEQVIDEATKAVTTHRLYCASSNTVTVTQQLSVDGVVYEVVSVVTPQDKTSNHHLQVDLRRVK